MTKRKALRLQTVAASAPAAVPAATKALTKLRAGIDAVDDRIVALLNRRAALAQKIGHIKARAAQPAHVPERERQLLARLTALNPGPLGGDSIRCIYKEIISASLALECPLQVAFVGPPASPAHTAAKAHFGSRARLKCLGTVADVFAEVEAGRCEYGVVPSESATEGLGLATIEQMVRSDLLICAELNIKRVPNHTARFAVVGTHAATPTGDDRTSILFATKNASGSLYEVIQLLARNKINMTRIESRPARRRQWDVLFYVDLDGHQAGGKLPKALKDMAELCSFLKVLGSYPKARNSATGGTSAMVDKEL